MKTSFSLSSFTVGEIGIDPLKIWASGGPDFSRLNINVDVEMKPVTPMLRDEQYPAGRVFRHTLIQLLGTLSFRGRSGQEVEIAEFSSKPLLHLSNDYPTSYQFSITLDLARVNRIEEQRAGDISFTLHFTALLAKHPGTVVGERSQDINESILALRSTNFVSSVQIPQSHWVNSILPGLGYGKIKIVEVPTPDVAIPEIFAQAIKEFEKAQQYMKQADFDKAVSHCRNALDLIPKVVHLKFDADAKPSYPDRIKKLLREHLPVPLGDSKREAIEKMLMSLWSLTSISHHQNSQSSGYFSRADADLIMLMTIAILSYVGRSLSAN